VRDEESGRMIQTISMGREEMAIWLDGKSREYE